MLGQTGATAWSELWELLGPLALQLKQGVTLTRYDQLLFMQNHEQKDIVETYFSWFVALACAVKDC